MVTTGKKREFIPRAAPTAVAGVDGVEIWKLFDWYGPSRCWFPDFTLVAPMLTGEYIKYRHAARQHVTGGSVITLPDQVFQVDDAGGPMPSENQAVLTALVVPTNILSEEEQRRLRSCSVDPALPGDGWTDSLTDLILALQNPALLPCEKEIQLRAFMERALMGTNVVERRGDTASHGAVERAREYLQANCSKTFSLNDVAREAGLTKWHLARSFRRAVGMSMGEYVRHVRGHRALALLRRGEAASVVAAELGYSDQPHLTRELRNMFGFTPGQYGKGQRLPRIC